MTTKQKILQEAIEALQVEFEKASQESTKALSKSCLNIDVLSEQSEAIGKMKGITACLDVLRDRWISALNEEDR